VAFAAPAGVRAARTGYIGIERTRLAPLLRIPAVQRLKARVTYMPTAQVVALLGQLDAAGVRHPHPTTASKPTDAAKI
jgi:hypothetical protein